MPSSSPILVKICGLTRHEDMVLVGESGAWAVGMVFAPSPRRVTPAEARVLVEGAAESLRTSRIVEASTVPDGGVPNATQGEGPLVIGVFGDVAAGEIAEVARQVGLDGVQLHGASGPRVAEVRDALADMAAPRLFARDAPVRRSPPARATRAIGPKVLVIRAVPVDPEADDPGGLVARIVRAGEGADLLLLDTAVRGRFGGTGTAFPWGIAATLPKTTPFLIAGGIGPENAAAALRLSRAVGIDVSSGVEESPGVKDPARVEALMAEVEAFRGAGYGARIEGKRERGSPT